MRGPVRAVDHDRARGVGPSGSSPLSFRFHVLVCAHAFVPVLSFSPFPHSLILPLLFSFSLSPRCRLVLTAPARLSRPPFRWRLGVLALRDIARVRIW